MIVAVTSRFITIPGRKGFSQFQAVPKTIVDKAEQLGIQLVSMSTPKQSIMSICDGLIATGSSINIHPSYYGKQDANFNETIDEFKTDKVLIDWFMHHNKPIMGICGGLQAINVALGGTLKKVDNHNETMHNIEIETNGNTHFLSKLGSEYTINSFHRYAIDKPAESIRVIAKSSDNTIEAIEHINNRCIGVQWHPEEMQDDVLENMFKYLWG